MIINKRCIAAFADSAPVLALATKSKLFDPTFSLTSELILVEYLNGKIHEPVTTEMKFCCMLWCETPDGPVLAAGHENGLVSLYKLTGSSLEHITTRALMEDDVTALEYLPSKAVLVAGSLGGSVVFLTLTDLSKEYSLGIPLSMEISSMAWNPKVTKILCVASRSGSIKVLDIKRNSCVMTLTHPGLRDIRRITWDSEKSTRLLALGSSGPIYAFDLSMDSVSSIGREDSEIIGYRGATIVYKDAIDDASVHTKIAQSISCAISSRDPMIALSRTDGRTELMMIPRAKRRQLLLHKGSAIYWPEDKQSQIPVGEKIPLLSSRIILDDAEEEPDEDGPFFQGLVALIKKKAPSREIAEYLLSAAREAPGVPLTDPNVALIRGQLDSFTAENKTVDFSFLIDILTNNKAALQGVSDFPLLLVLSKIMKDFSGLTQLGDAKIVAAILLFHDVSDFSVLPETPEGKAIHGLLTGNLNEYAANRIKPASTYMAGMKRIGEIFKEASELGDAPLTSGVAVEYFWYCQFQGEIEKTDSFRIESEEIRRFKAAQTAGAAGVAAGVKGLRMDRPSTTRVLDQRAKQPEAVPAVPKSIPRNPSTLQGPRQAYDSYGSRPSPNEIPTRPAQSPMALTPPTQFAPQAPRQPSASRPSPQFQTTPPAQFTPPSIPTSPSQVPHFATTPTATPTQPRRPFPSPPNRPMPPASTEPADEKLVKLMPSPRAPSAFPAPKIPVPGPQSTPQARAVQTPSPSASMDSQDVSRVLGEFESLLSSLKSLAATKNSLIIRPRKNACLNAVETYYSYDKGNITPGMLHAMEALCTRVERPDGTLKPDVDLIVEPHSECLWLKAAADLVKLLY